MEKERKVGRPKREGETSAFHVVISADVARKFRVAAARRGLMQRTAIEAAMKLWASPKMQKALAAYEFDQEFDDEEDDELEE